MHLQMLLSSRRQLVGISILKRRLMLTQLHMDATTSPVLLLPSMMTMIWKRNGNVSLLKLPSSRWSLTGISIQRRRLTLNQMCLEETTSPVLQLLKRKTMAWKRNVNVSLLKLPSSRWSLTGISIQRRRLTLNQMYLEETTSPVLRLLKRKTMAWKRNVNVFLLKLLSSSRWLIGVTIQTNQLLVMVSLPEGTTLLAFLLLKMIWMRNVNLYLQKLLSSSRWLIGVTIQINQLLVMASLPPETTLLVLRHPSTKMKTTTSKRNAVLFSPKLRSSRRSLRGITNRQSLSSPTLLS